MSGWDGYPQDREVHGLRLLADAISGELFAMTWWPGHQKWLFEGEWGTPEQMACHIYLGRVITPAQHATEVEQARREGAPFADLTDDERIVGVIRSTNRNGQDVRVMVKQWDCFDGAPPHITIAVHVGEGRWVEAEMKPEDALKVVHLALLKPAIRARGGSDAG
ncbi:hypothetical protein [Rhodovarius lipocyclicus]|uniref:hypothetical protein n=1 Tax=Rhodovarius lipocyclicus TaxID=268410 RepID=UPI00135BABC8|nr:hypothetical protein [Rhodovarius lipocyclicus]